MGLLLSALTILYQSMSADIAADGLFVVLVIALFGEETMYDRYLRPIPHPRTPRGTQKYRIESLLGITGWQLRRYRTSFARSIWDTVDVAWRPQTLLISVYAGCMFGFGIGEALLSCSSKCVMH